MGSEREVRRWLAPAVAGGLIAVILWADGLTGWKYWLSAIALNVLVFGYRAYWEASE